MTILKRIVAAPVFDDAEKNRVAHLLRNILLVALIGQAVIAGLLFLNPRSAARVPFSIVAILVTLATFYLLQNGRVRSASILFLGGTWVTLTIASLTSTGVHTPSFSGYVVVIIMAAALLRERGAIIVTLVSVISGLLMVYAETQGMLTFPDQPLPPPLITLALHILIFLASATLIYATSLSIENAFSRLQQSEQKLNERNQELERHIRERQQAESERDRLFELSFDLIVAANSEGYFKQVNPAFIKTFGYTEEELLSRTYLDFIHPDDRDSTLKEIEKLAVGAPIVNFENCYRSRDGQYRWLSWNANPSDGLVYAIARDVTEQRQINDALRESEEKYRTLFENTGLYTLIYNRDGIILLANKFTGERLGKEPATLIGNSILDSFPLGQGEPYLERIQRVIDSGEGEITEDFTYWGSGERWYLTNTQPIFDGAGRALTALVISQDITAHKQAEKQQIELRLAQEKAAFLADFLGDMSHDLKTPLSIINNSLYLLERINDPEKQRSNIQQIKDQTRLVEKFIQDILTVAQLENQPQLNCQDVNINQLLTGIAGQLRAKAEQKRIQTSLRLNDELPPIWADQGQMTRAFVNLVENAINYTLDNGSVEIRTYAHEDRVIVEIRDTGIGIGKDDLPHVFERFYRSGQARSLETGGTGLGLAIAKKIIDVHGCGIDVSSEPGEGTTFRVQMPVKV